MPKKPMPTKSVIMKKLKEVNDPELNISIVDLGLVYNVEIIKTGVVVTMTLTTIGCPLFSLIEQEIYNKLHTIGLSNVKITLTFDPPWTMEKMSEKAKAKLGII
jgi:metal-sulfur cluster biosynthetic enzyme